MIHLAFANDFSSPDAPAKAVAEESTALASMGEELLGSGRPLVNCSVTPWVPGRVSIEADPLPTDGPVGGRAALNLASHGVRTTAVRLPRTVHNEGTSGFAGLLTEIARRTRVSGFPGDGTRRWPAVHVLDAPVLFRLALEQAPAGTFGTPWLTRVTRVTRCMTSQPSSAGGWDCRSRQCPKRRTVDA